MKAPGFTLHAYLVWLRTVSLTYCLWGMWCSVAILRFDLSTVPPTLHLSVRISWPGLVSSSHAPGVLMFLSWGPWVMTLGWADWSHVYYDAAVAELPSRGTSPLSTTEEFQLLVGAEREQRLASSWAGHRQSSTGVSRQGARVGISFIFICIFIVEISWISGQR